MMSFFGFSYVVTKTVGGGFIALGLLSLWGVALITKGIQGDTLDWLGHSVAPRWIYVTFGAILQLPLMAFAIFIYKATAGAN